MSSFNNEVADQAEFVTLRSTCGVAGNANPGANRLVEPFEARAGIEHVSQGGIFEAAWRADIADQGDPCMNADTGDPEIDTSDALLGDEPISEVVKCQRGAKGSVGMIGLRMRSSKKRQYRVTNELIDQTAICEYGLASAREVFIEQRCHGLRLHRLGQGREIRDVGKQHRNFAALAPELG